MFRYLLWSAFFLTFSAAHAMDLGVEKLTGPRGSNGLAIGSFSFSGQELLSGAHILIHPKTDPKEKTIIALGQITFRGENLTNNDGRWGKLAALNLEPGEWVIDTFSAYVFPYAGAQSEMRNSAPIRKSFKVEAGKTTYIGNIDFTVRLDQGPSIGSVVTALLFGATSGAVSGEPVVYDAREKDFKLLKEKSPELDIAAIKIDLISRDNRDQEAIDTLAQMTKQAGNGDRTAQALINTAKIFGEARLPNFTALRMTRTLHHDKAALDKFRETGVPFAQSALTQNHAGKLSPQEIAALQLAAGQNYDKNAISILSSRNGPYREDSGLKSLWDSRESKLGAGFSSWNVEQFGQIIGKSLISEYKALSAPRKMLLLSALGDSQIYTDDGKDDIKQSAQKALDKCRQAHGPTCAIVAEGNGVTPSNLCPLTHQFTGAAMSMAPTSLPSITNVAQRTERPWSAAFKEWEDKSKDHLGYPRAIAWNEATGKLYPATGSCTSGARAMAACKKESGNSCKIIVQDDRLIEGSEYAERITLQLIAATKEHTLEQMTSAKK
jgi:hypothetical protein